MVKVPRRLYFIVPPAAAVVAAVAIYFLVEQYFVSNAKEEIRDILLSNQGFHQYVQYVLHPAIYDAMNHGMIDRNFYEPEAMSSTYIVREMHRFYNDERAKLGMQPVYYKLAALNPRNPVNMADAWESEKIRLFNSDSSVHEQQEIISRNDTSYLYYAIPFLRNEQRCMVCHGDPADAPPGLRRLYPRDGGFHEKVGDIRAIESLRVPIESEGRIASVLAAASGAGFFSLLVLMFFNSSLKTRVRRKTKELEEEIAERKRAEASIANEKERLLVTLRSIGDAVIATDVQGRVALMNKVAEELTGWSMQEVVGDPLTRVFVVINEHTRERLEDPVNRVLSSGMIVELANHTLLVSKDGVERAIADSAAPIKDRNSVTIGVVLVFRDMTEKQELLESAQNAQKLESIGVLAAGIAHDFNNLLGGIYGYIDLAAQQTDEKRHTTYLTKALATIDRARALTTQLLTFSKGGAPIQKVDHLFPFVEETAHFALSGSNVSCRTSIPDDLWPCSFDRNQIAQVIDNLVINAQQAMPLGGTIDLAASNVVLTGNEGVALPGGRYVKISVHDRGTGIPKELLPRIFDPFFTTKAKGHGLGLATCYSIINRHGGRIEVESELGKGSAFHVYLPAVDQPVPAASPDLAASHAGHAMFLVMDDEDVVRETICEMLGSLGYEVVCAVNGEDAIARFRSERGKGKRFAGIIFDLTVPGGMDGATAVRQVRTLDATVPVFVASGYSDDPVMKNPAEYGFTSSICKPFRKRELVGMLNTHLGSGPATV